MEILSAWLSDSLIGHPEVSAMLCDRNSFIFYVPLIPGKDEIIANLRFFVV